MDKYDYLYPTLQDEAFAEKISRRKEFRDTSYQGDIASVEKMSDKMCNAAYELAPHQQFVRNFLSSQTPYNSMLLYHGLGSGKTCSAISVAEESREFFKFSGMPGVNKIIVIASPNVQDNFKKQLFNEKSLTYTRTHGWTVKDSCAGNTFINEILLANNRRFKENQIEMVIKNIKRIIKKHYMFLGYAQFYNYFIKKIIIGSDVETAAQKKALKKRVNKWFAGCVFIIDEAHNIRSDVESGQKDGASEGEAETKAMKGVTKSLEYLANHADNVKFLLLSATPMYNSPKEIVGLLNLMNRNDGRRTIRSKDLFNTAGDLKISDDGTETGRAMLEKHARGYISFVRGENPYTFPYRVWPQNFDTTASFLENNKNTPTTKLNGKKMDDGIQNLDLFVTPISSFQESGYRYMMNRLNTGKKRVYFDNDKLNYDMVTNPIQALNILYPHDELEIDGGGGPNDIKELIGNGGLDRIMSYTDEKKPVVKRYNFDYKDIEKYGPIFSPENIGRYSAKIKAICERVVSSEGVVIVYSQFIDGGLVPLALALEQLGFSRAGSTHNLFKKTRLPKNNGKLKYAMITGDKAFSPDNVKELKLVTDPKNVNGDYAKVVLISRAGSEGLDFKFIRQVHIMEPWFNMSRIEQIIGRAVRTCSHKNLEFSKRNVEIYLHCLSLAERLETVDMYMYRKAEKKSIQIGRVSRVLKEVSADCLLNINQSGFTEANMKQVVNLTLSSVGPDGSAKKINYKVGDKPFSSTCDYMEDCQYRCSATDRGGEAVLDTYNAKFLYQDTQEIKNSVTALMSERYFYRRSQLEAKVNAKKSYPASKIDAALNEMVHGQEQIVDKYDRRGTLIRVGDVYLFQPRAINNEKISVYDRTHPVEEKIRMLKVNVSDAEVVEGFDDVGFSVLQDLMDKYKYVSNDGSSFDSKTPFQRKTYTLLRDAYTRMGASGKDVLVMRKVLIARLIEELNYDDLQKLVCYFINYNNTDENEFEIELCKEYLKGREVQQRGNPDISYLLYDVNKNETYSAIKIHRNEKNCEKQDDLPERAVKDAVKKIQSNKIQVPYLFIGLVNPSDDFGVLKRVKQLGFTGVKDSTPHRGVDEFEFRYNDAISKDGKRSFLTLVEHKIIVRLNKSNKN